MSTRFSALFYNHCKEINAARYASIDYVFDVSHPLRSVSNLWHKLYYYIFSMQGLSNILSLLQTMGLLVLNYGAVPKHLSFIMDGNRRFAKSINQPFKKGHELGSLTLLQVIYFAKMIGVEHLSVYAFSIENFNRSEKEVTFLMELLVKKLTDFSTSCRENKLSNNLIFNGIQIKSIGDSSYLDKDINSKVKDIEALTSITDKHSHHLTIYICCPYTCRNEIYHAIKKNVILKMKNYESYSISEKNLENEMCLSRNINRCDLLIRTSGITRFSDYLMWQTHESSSFVFSLRFWPDYGFVSFFLDLFKWGFYKSFSEDKKGEKAIKKPSSCMERNKSKTKGTKLLIKPRIEIVFLKLGNILEALSRLIFTRKRSVSVADLPCSPPAVSAATRS